MKKSLIALAVLAASGASIAQSSVTLYGGVDAYVGSVRASGQETQTVLNSGNTYSSRFGFKGSEDLGGGLKANFLLEQQFNVDTGAATVPGQAFSRQSYVGFSGGFGEVKLGKIWTAYDDISAAANPAWDSFLSPNVNVWASTGYNANPANGAYYASPSMSGFSGALSYALGENKNVPTPGVDASSVAAFHVKYEAGPIYAGLAYQREESKGVGALSTTNFTRLNGTYDFGMAKLLAGFGRVTGPAGVRTNEWQLGADVPVGSAVLVTGGIARSNDNSAAGDATREGYSLAASYSLSKRTALYTGYQHSRLKTPGLANFDQSTLALGVRHTF